VVVDGYDVTVTVNVDENATGFVKFTLNGNNIFAEVIDGKAVINMILPAGNYTVPAAYLGDDDFNANATEIEIEVSEISLNDTQITAEISLNENNVTITVSVDPAATGLVRFEISGAEKYTLYADVIGGKAVLEDVLAAGDYSVLITYLGDDKFNPNSTTETFTVVGHVKNDTSIDAVSAVANYTVTITTSIDPAATGHVAIAVLGQTFIVPVNNGEAVFSFDFAPGNYSAVVTYLGDDNFNNASTVTSFTVNEPVVELQNTTISVDVSSVENNVTIVAIVDSAATGFIEFNIGGKSVYIAVDNGVAVYDVVLPAGNYTVVATYMGDDKFYSNATSSEFTISEKQKEDTNVTINIPGDIKTGDDIPVEVSIPGATGNVSVIVDGVENVVHLDENGTATYTIPEVTGGEHSVVVVYDGDDTHNGAHAVATIYLEEFATRFTNVTVADGKITGILTLPTGDGLPNAVIGVKINGAVSNVTTDAKGVFTVEDVFGKVVELNYAGNGTILPTDMSIDLTGVVSARQATQIIGNNYTQYAVEYYAGERGQDFKTQLFDLNGNPLANKKVFIGVNGVMRERTTDAFGFTSVQINFKDANRLTFAVAFLGDEDYNASMAVYLIVIVKKPVSISAPTKTYKVATKTKTYTVTLKTNKCASADGKTYFGAGKKVTLKVNGKTYTAKTNAKGQATFKITNLNKKGKFAAVIKYAGDTTYNAASKSVKLTIN
ncbi:Ig-like domain-containing protein, partial [Methanobrevibacter sp.]|uniref:Ig-like domain-containing protein n=1 Tax=Methanobrevibacter sp. TaxID=66852 RepID=UPI00388FF9B5